MQWSLLRDLAQSVLGDVCGIVLEEEELFKRYHFNVFKAAA
jgi:hypothetical protein